MRKARIFAMLLLWSGLQLNAQVGQNATPDPQVIQHPLQEITLAGRVIAGELEEGLSPFLKNTRVNQPPRDQFALNILKAREEANKTRSELLVEGSSQKTDGVSSLGPVEIGQQFEGNSYNGIPNDNAMAVSANRTVVSAHNSRIHAYNGTTGASLLSISMASFVAGAGMPINDKFDPRVVYDPTADRFIICFLNGFSSSTSKIILAFSETNDPAGAWNLYAVNGSPVAGAWTDFPQMAISSTELFITGNLFDNSDMSVGAAVWQIELADGYAGTALTTQVYTNSYFSLTPVGGGLTMYGPHFYIIRGEEGGGNNVWIHRISNTIAAGGVMESPVGFSSPEHYFFPPDVSQKGTTRKLRTNSCRIQNAYFENSRIYFVLNSAISGRASIFVGWFIISPFGLSFSALDGQHIYFPDVDIAYPGIAYGGEMGTKGNASFIVYNTTSTTNYPGNAATWMDGNHDLSPFQSLKVGTSSINGGQNPSRWGDYADACEVAGSPGEAYVVGSYGKNSGQCGTYLSQLFEPLPVAVEQPDFWADEVSMYPNPASSDVHFDFNVPVSAQYEVTLLDQQGKLVQHVINERLREGEARLRFNTAPLENGVYIVRIAHDGQPIYHGKLVVVH